MERLEWLRNLQSPLLIFVMCLKCNSTVSDTKLYCSSKPLLLLHTTARATATALSWMRTTPASWCQPCEYSCCRDPVSCLLPALSHQPILRNIFVVNVLLYSVSASLQIILLKAAFGRQSAGGVEVRLFCLPYMIKTNLFSSKAKQIPVTLLSVISYSSICYKSHCYLLSVSLLSAINLPAICFQSPCYLLSVSLISAISLPAICYYVLSLLSAISLFAI